VGIRSRLCRRDTPWCRGLRSCDKDRARRRHTVHRRERRR